MTYLFKSLKDRQLIVEVVVEGDQLSVPFTNGFLDTDSEKIAKALIAHDDFGKLFILRDEGWQEKPKPKVAEKPKLKIPVVEKPKEIKKTKVQVKRKGRKS